ncbi:MAG TPA: glycosyltransferase N-terminal domain-containing protein [Candidatus Udaeobacter sp.]|nr:glycosyltransferase N-terminal domain-containing protein [Candidatus Udaeobacter sp.]
MIRLIYNLFWPIGLLFFLPGYLVKMIRRGGYRAKFGQRFGIYDRELRVRLEKRRSTWLHAVSVGEVNIALKLSRALRALEPELCCVLTTTTTTGFALAQRNAPPWIEVLYTPLDYWPIMRRAFSVIRPTRVILVEAEVWPNLVALAHQHGIPTILANARLSDRSERRFRRFRLILGPTFRLLDLVCVQEPDDVQRWAAIGIPRDRIRLVGSVKYDPDAHEAVLRRQESAQLQQVETNHFNSKSQVLFGGSTHRGEEEILAKIFLGLRQQFPSLQLFIAPRHVERLREIRTHFDRLPLRVTLASELASGVQSEWDCIVLDTTGDLHRWYSVASIVFIGKSLTAHGGQNPVEAIVAGKPVVFGPHMENFATLAKSLVLKNGAIQVLDVDSLQTTVAELLRDSQACERLVQQAHEVLNEHRGATTRTATLIHELTPIQ